MRLPVFSVIATETFSVGSESESANSIPESQSTATLLLQVVGLLCQLRAEVEEIRDQISGRVKQYYPVDEAAEILGRSAYTVRRWVKVGRIKAIRIDGTGPKGRLLIARAELTHLLESGLGGNAPAIITE